MDLRNRIGRLDRDLHYLWEAAGQAREAAERGPIGTAAPLVAALHLALAEVQRRTDALKAELIKEELLKKEESSKEG